MKQYIKFDDASSLEEGLPKGISFISSDIFAIVEDAEMPAGARLATSEEMTTPTDLIAQIGKDIESSGDAFQTEFLGATSSKREARFARNLAVAKRLIAGDYTPAELGRDLKTMHTMSLTMQAEAQAEGRSVDEFAEWIVAWEGKSDLIAGAIEAFIKTQKLALPNIPNLIDPAVRAQHSAKLKAEAIRIFSEMTA